jgi:heat shock protein HslJ
VTGAGVEEDAPAPVTVVEPTAGASRLEHAVRTPPASAAVTTWRRVRSTGDRRTAGALGSWLGAVRVTSTRMRVQDRGVSGAAGAASALVGSTYRVVEIGGEPALRTPTAELSFGTDGRITGRATVNRVFGTYRLVGDEITFGPLGSTLMAGPPEAMDQERRLLRALGRGLVVAAGAPGGRVSLLAEGTPVLVLEPATCEM